MKATRARAGLTQADVAARLGLGARALEAWEQGSKVPSDATLTALAALYGTHPAVLRYGESVLRDAAAIELHAVATRAAAELRAVADRLAGVVTPIDVAAIDRAADGPVVMPTAPAGALPRKRRRG